GAVLLLLPLLTAARPTGGPTPTDRPGDSVRPVDRTARDDARDHRSPGRPALDAVPTLLDTSSRPRNRQNEPISPASRMRNRQNEPISPASRVRNRQNEPISPASRVRNRQNEPIFAPDSPLLAVRPPRSAPSADRSR